MYWPDEALNARYVPVSIDRLDGELIVGASIPMSSFCYTVFRLDPYIGCEHSCAYCYTRFFPSLNVHPVKVRVGFSRLFRRAVESFKRAGVPLPVFRLSELTDGLQPVEEKLKISYRTMRVCLDEEVPLIVSTKSVLVAQSPWLDVLKELAGEGLAIAQITVTLLDDRAARVIEPFAPPPSERLEAAARLADEGIPVVFRLQPIVPFLNSGEDFAEEYVDAARSVGARKIIAEVLRITRWSALEPFRRLLSPAEYARLTDRSLWEHYPGSSHKHPRKVWRLKTYSLFISLARKRGLHFSVCREGFYGLNAAPDCCGVHFMGKRVLRPTLYEFLHGFKPGYEYITLEDVERLPLPGLRRKFRKHVEIAENVARSPELLDQLLY